MEPTEQPLEIRARDGRILAGLLLRAEAPQWAVVFSSGAAVKKEAYLNFARAGAQRGAAVLLYDFRDQGASLVGPARAASSDFVDWGRLDLPAAIDTIGQALPGLPVVTLNHSVGGQILGLADNISRPVRHGLICACWPYWRHKPLSFACQELFLWHVYGPACLRLFGCVPRGGLWRGEALNPKLFATWKRWCLSAHCTADGMAADGGPSFFRAIVQPVRAFCYTDDPIATRQSVPPLLDLFSSAAASATWFQPSEFGLTTVGHQGIFSRKAQRAWEPIWDWVLAR